MTREGVLLEVGDRTVACCLDSVERIGERGFLITGWLTDSDDQPVRMALIDALGRSVELGEDTIWYSRPDAADYCGQMGWGFRDDEIGFQAFVGLETLSGSQGLFFEVVLESGVSQRISVAAEATVPTAVVGRVRALAESLAPARWDVASRLEQIGPAIEGLWDQRSRRSKPPKLQSFGRSPRRPSVSLVVSVVAPLETVRYQLALLAEDQDLESVEVIYVADDPDLTIPLLEQCDDWHQIFGVPFSVVSSGHRLGGAVATNLGVEQATGRFLVLMASNVFPREAGWISGLRRTLVQLPEAGAIAPVLLHEDESIQHAGLGFEPHQPWGGLWVQRHLLKGMPTSVLPESCFGVAALSGSCLMLNRLDYHRIGGFDERYIAGGCEGSDLSLRLRRHGLRCFVDPSVALYRLTLATQPAEAPAWRQGLTLYNCWRQNRVWGEEIGKLAAVAAPAGGVVVQ